MSSADSILSSESHRAYLRGDFSTAISRQIESVAEARERGDACLPEQKRLALYLFSGGKIREAVSLLQEIRTLAPEDPEIPENIGVLLRQMGDLDGAILSLREAHALAPDKANVCDALAHCLGNQGSLEESRHFGRLALELKDAEAAARPPHWSLPGTPPPSFLPGDPAKNVIAFSLWGQNPRYLDGAIRNATLARDLFPQWTCRFYHDASVPAAIVRQLRSLGSQVISRPRPAHFYEGLMWRFEVIADPGVRHFLIRDCDSVLSVRERVAVDAWLRSDRWFHAMRDFLSHTEVLLAGMWGGVNGALPSMPELMAQFRPRVAPTRTFDQLFLREVVWPTVRQSVLIHDSVYTGCLGSVPFPQGGEIPCDWHVGQNESAIPSRPRIPPPAITPGEACRFVLTGTDPQSLVELRQLLTSTGHCHCGAPTDLDALGKTLDLAAAAIDLPSAASQRLWYRMLSDALDALSAPSPDQAGSIGGIAIAGPTERLPQIMHAAPEARLLFIIRDLRDIARSSPQDAGSLAHDWVGSIALIKRLSTAHPGRVDIVRNEDLRSATAGRATRSRVADFLGLDAASFPMIDPSSDRPFPALAPERAQSLEQAAGKWLRLLRYSPEIPADGLPA